MLDLGPGHRLAMNTGNMPPKVASIPFLQALQLLFEYQGRLWKISLPAFAPKVRLLIIHSELASLRMRKR
ncbi:MAG: hypothetical protein KBG02_16400 [Haliscomenobacter sp.]|nr:hypothetical protein [Haliscomenobacter sp.]MBP9078451.1 hypothetical protein [Haliscomenobacter sp.]MBP9875227.1 hypothetical protein [Haliscomenobacter sp.]